jgi:hypothetical protein
MVALERLKDLSSLPSIGKKRDPFGHLMWRACPIPCWRESGRKHETNMDMVKYFTSNHRQSIAWAPNCHVWVVAWRIIVGSRPDDLIYWTYVLKLQFIIIAHILKSFYTTSIRRISLLSESRTGLWFLEFWISTPRWLLGGPHRRHHIEQLIALCCPVGYPLC